MMMSIHNSCTKPSVFPGTAHANNELCGKIPSAVDQLRERRLTFASNCYMKTHLVLWEGKPGKMLRAARQQTHICQTTSVWFNACCMMIDELQRRMKHRKEWSAVAVLNSEWLWSLGKWMNGCILHICLQWKLVRGCIFSIFIVNFCHILQHILYTVNSIYFCLSIVTVRDNRSGLAELF